MIEKRKRLNSTVRTTLGERQGTKKGGTSVAERKPFEEMTEAEKYAAFQKWVGQRELRRGQSGLRRIAVKALITAHQDEYNELLAAAGGKPVAKKK